MLLPFLLAMTPAPDLIPFAIGTYTGPASDPESSQGIYHATLDQTSGALSTPQLAASAQNPSYLAFSPDVKTLYAVHEWSNDPAQNHQLTAFQWSPHTPLKATARIQTPGQGPCHLVVSPDGRTLLTANYGDGTVVRLALDSNQPPQTIAHFTNQGSGPDQNRQKGPHAHAAAIDRQNRFAFTTDLGTDEILTFDLQYPGFQPAHRLRLPPGSGPRHLVLHPNNQHAYVNFELTNQVAALTLDAVSGQLKRVQTLSTLPAGHDQGTTAAILLHPSGKTLYVTNRGHDSAAVFQIQAEGTLALLEIVPLQVASPRGAAISPGGNWLLVAGQLSNTVRSLKIDAQTGRLTPTTHQIQISKPTDLKFPPNP